MGNGIMGIGIMGIGIMGIGIMSGLGWAGMGLMGLWMLLPVGLVIGALWLLPRGVSGLDRGRASEDADEILRRRLATGEIDVETYERARVALGLSGGTGAASR